MRHNTKNEQPPSSCTGSFWCLRGQETLHHVLETKALHQVLVQSILIKKPTKWAEIGNREWREKMLRLPPAKGVPTA
jgi:hypothetical protein